MPNITPKARASGTALKHPAKALSGNEMRQVEAFVQLFKNPAKKFGNDSLCTIYNNLFAGIYGEVQATDDGRLFINIDGTEEKNGLDTTLFLEERWCGLVNPSDRITVRMVKIPYFKLNEDTGRYKANRTLTGDQILKAAAAIASCKIKRGDPLTSAEATRIFLKQQLQNRECEYFACLFMDNQHRVIEYEELFRGTVDGASIYPREVLKRCLELNAEAVIFAHNHPSGGVEPSYADRCITDKLKEALGLVDIRVLDHFIVGDGSPYSFAEHGQI